MTPGGDGAAAEKARLREALLRWRRGLRPEDIRGWSRGVAAHLLAWPGVSGAGVVAAYAALPREPQTAELIRAWRRRGVHVALPVVVGADIELQAPPTPGAGREVARVPVAPGSVDVILVPGLGFDLAGRRLGRGGGHYDRFLPRLRADCLRVGLCFAGQVLPALPVEPWDESVDVVVTEGGGWEGVRRRGGGAEAGAGGSAG